MTTDATLSAYDRFAAEYADDWLTQDTPSDLYADLARWLIPGGASADIGCGSGREVAWLNANGYPAVGYDASMGLLDEARRRFPALSFRYARLPALAEIDRQFANVVCETVIMHLERPAIAAALRNLARIVRPGGILYVSWRVTEAPDGADQIDARGRRYACFPADEVTGALSGMQVLEHRDRISRSSGKRIGIVVARKAEET